MKAYQLHNLFEKTNCDIYDIELVIIPKDAPPSGGPITNVQFDDGHKLLILEYDERKTNVVGKQ